MKIKTVTITGADDKTDINQMIDLSKKFPFVEWGLLFSPNPERKGTPRYPSTGWLQELKTKRLFVIGGMYGLPGKDYIAKEPIEMQFSAHLCGGYTKELLNNGSITSWLTDCRDIEPIYFFGRYQYNFNALRHTICKEFNEHLSRMSRPVILQLNKNNKFLCQEILTNCGHNKNIQFLHDASGGLGISPQEWGSPTENHLTGYAGGLTPENLEEQLLKINEVAGEAEIWIDTETGVRTNNELDMDKVFSFLKTAEKYT